MSRDSNSKSSGSGQSSPRVKPTLVGGGDASKKEPPTVASRFQSRFLAGGWCTPFITLP
jgi:hypothetical protein